MNINRTRVIQRTLSALFALVLLTVVGCSSTTPGPGAADARSPGSFTIREGQVLRMDEGGTGEGTLIYLGWQHTFEIKNMALGGIGGGAVELHGDVWHLETLEDFEGTYTLVAADVTGGKGLSGVWAENEKGVRLHVNSKGQDLSIRLHADGAIITLK